MSGSAIAYFFIGGIVAALGFSVGLLIPNPIAGLYAYSVVIYAIWKLTWFAPGWLRVSLAVLPLGISAFALPSVMNRPLLAVVAEFKAQQLPLSTPRSLPDTLAILDPLSSSQFNPGPIGCNDFCQDILYGGFTKTVIVARLISLNGTQYESDVPTAFAIERRDNCLDVPIPPGTKPTEHVALRIELGECLTARPAKVEEATTIFTWGLVDDDNVTIVRNYSYQPKREARYIEVGRKLVLEKQNGDWHVVVLEDALRWYPISIPLIPFHTSMVGGKDFSSPVPMGWQRDRRESKSGLWLKKDGNDVFGAVFGVTLPSLSDRYRSSTDGAKEAPSARAPSHAEVSAALRIALDDPAVSPERFALLAESYNLSLGAHGAPTRVDLDLVQILIRDPRLPDGFDVPVENLGPLSSELARPLVVELTKAQRDNSSKAYIFDRAIARLPYGAAKTIFDDLVAISAQEIPKYGGAWPGIALVRLADEGKKALPVFIQLVEGLESFSPTYAEFARRHAYTGMSCLLRDAAPAKDMLIERLKVLARSNDKRDVSQAISIMRVLIAMGAERDVFDLTTDSKLLFYHALALLRKFSTSGLKEIVPNFCLPPN